jgi:pSer/pThr/pTyr-binding forkhead associated (FHA) protein
MSSTLCKNDVIAILEWTSKGKSHSRELLQGDRLFAGSDETSDLCLSDSGVAATHCVIFAKSGSVTIEDCYSLEGTYVDGRRIRSERLSRSTEVKLGSAIVTVKLPGPSTLTADTKARTPSATPALCDGIPNMDHSPPGRNTVPDRTLANGDESERSPFVVSRQTSDHSSETTLSEADSQAVVDDLRFQLLEAKEEIRILQRRLESSVRQTPCENNDSRQQEMIELLRAEVLELQAALAERENLGFDLRPSAPLDEDVLPRAEAEKLVQRLEQLLSELQDRDEQINSLTDLLAAAEDANQMELEERTQMDQWVRDIEQRFGSREQEWQEERLVLQKSIDAMAAERDRAEAALNADTASGKLEAAQNMLRSLRETASAQRQQLVGSEQLIQELRGRLEQAQSLHSHEDRMQLIQERAELARQRQELETLRHQQHGFGTDETALKLRALRQHLNEIHEEERAEREERKLSTRISKLWRRLEGR